MIWDLNSLKIKENIDLGEPVRCVAFSPKDQKLAVGTTSVGGTGVGGSGVETAAVALGDGANVTVALGVVLDSGVPVADG